MTYFCTLNKPETDITVGKYIELVKGGFVKDRILQIRDYDARGWKKEMEARKKSLPGITHAARFGNGRKAEFFKGLTGLTVLDIDGLKDDELADLRSRLQTDPHVLSINVSVRGHGLKVLVPYEPESGTLPTTWEECRPFYAGVYRQVSGYFATTYGCEIDTSGKDITRLNFLSYDPEPYYNPEAQPFLTKGELVKGEVKGEKGEVEKSKPKAGNEAPAKKGNKHLDSLLESTRASEDRLEALFVIICKNLYSAGDRFRHGKRNDFVYKVASELNRMGITYEKTIGVLHRSAHRLAALENEIAGEKNAVQLLDMEEVDTTVKSVYTNHQGEHGTRKIGCSLMKHIYLQVEILRSICLRKNMLSLKIEYMRRIDRERGKEEYREFDDGMENHFAVRMKEMGQNIPVKQVHELINSPFTPEFDPVEHYLSHLPEWDGEDHIGRFADSVTTNDPARFRQLLKMWYVGMIMAYRHPGITNHIVITLYSAGEGIGKTNFVDRILPPELQEAVYQGMIRDQKDSLEKIATCLVISMDELNHYKREEMQQLKELITRKYIDFRVNYDRFGHRHYHRASFMATCNSTHFMCDDSGNRRFHVFEVAAVDMDYMPDYRQLFAQILHLIDTGFKYYFTSEEQEELSAYNYQFENNPEEYDFLVKYVRKYPSKCQQKRAYSATEIMQRMKFFNPEYVIDKPAQIRMGKALARKNYEYYSEHSKKMYYCYIMNAEQAEYVIQNRESDGYIDLSFDKFVPREILIAGDNAKIADIRKAREFLDQTGGKVEEAQMLYDRYIKDDREIKYTNEGTLPF